MTAALSALLGTLAAGARDRPIPESASAATASAVVGEVEPNGSPSTSTFMGGLAQGIAAAGTLTRGDVDVWGAWLGFQTGNSQWGFDLTVRGSGLLEVSVAQVVVTPIGRYWLRLARGSGQGLVELDQVEFQHWPLAPVPYLFVHVTGEPQHYTITAP